MGGSPIYRRGTTQLMLRSSSASIRNAGSFSRKSTLGQLGSFADHPPSGSCQIGFVGKQPTNLSAGNGYLTYFFADLIVQRLPDLRYRQTIKMG